MVIRDLTLRSAASFGSFHLIRLLYDEYMFYLIEHKVALSSGKTPIAIMTEVDVQYSEFIYMYGLTETPFKCCISHCLDNHNSTIFSFILFKLGQKLHWSV